MSGAAPLVSRTVSVASLDEGARRRMLALMQVCYAGVTRERFERDLASKAFVILLYARGTGDLVGFSTIRVAREIHDGRAVEVVFSGDTVIHPDHWGGKSLQAAFGRFVIGRKLRSPATPVLWLLLSGGYKTYLLMTNNFPASTPNRNGSATPARKALLHRLCAEWFGANFDAERGVVRFGADHYRVRDGVAPVDADTSLHPDVAFFLARNPRHAAGDELACLAELRLRDLARAFTRIGLAQARMLLRPRLRSRVRGVPDPVAAPATGKPSA